jgi:hypothetical protein
MDIIYNIVGGVIVAILTAIFLELRKKYYGYNFKKVFGRDARDDFNIVHGSMKLKPVFDNNGNSMKWPYYKDGIGGSFGNISSVVSLTGAKSIKYVSETFTKILGISPKLNSDIEVREKLDISFCSIGGNNNLKTRDVLNSDQNTFFDFDLSENSANIFSKKKKQKKFSINQESDYGFIIKITPKSFPKRVWICIAGLGEYGTSGAVWFAMKNWKKLPKNKSFGLIIKTRFGQDESAELVYKEIEK